VKGVKILLNLNEYNLEYRKVNFDIAEKEKEKELLAILFKIISDSTEYTSKDKYELRDIDILGVSRKQWLRTITYRSVYE